MAELLIKAISAVHHDPAQDQRYSYKRGDVVAIKPDGHVWGTLETLPAFCTVSVPGVPVSDLAYLRNQERDSVQEAINLAANGEGCPIYITRRGYRFNIDLLPDAAPDRVRQTLLTTGVVQVTKAQAEAVIEKKVNGI